MKVKKKFARWYRVILFKTLSLDETMLNIDDTVHLQCRYVLW